MRFYRILAFVAVFAPVSAWAVDVQQAWMRAMPPGQPTAAAYLELVNPGNSPVRLVAASCPLAKSVETTALTLEFDTGESLAVEVEIRAIDAGGPGGHHHH